MGKIPKMMSKRHDFAAAPTSIREMLRTIPVFNHFRVHACHNLTVPPRWHIKPRIIDDYHLIMVMSGEGTYHVADQTIPLFRGRIVFLSNGVQYSAEQNLANPPHIIPIRFFTYNNRDHRPANSFSRPVFISHVTKDTDRYQVMFETLHRQHIMTRGPFRTGYCSTLIHHILCDLLTETGSEPRKESRDNRIMKVQRFIATHPLDRSSVRELAQRSGLSEKYFTKLFKAQVGMTPKSYQVNARLNHARALLEDTGLSVKEISAQLGYPDPYVFSKQFKALFGLAPSQLR